MENLAIRRQLFDGGSVLSAQTAPGPGAVPAQEMISISDVTFRGLTSQTKDESSGDLRQD